MLTEEGRAQLQAEKRALENRIREQEQRKTDLAVQNRENITFRSQAKGKWILTMILTIVGAFMCVCGGLLFVILTETQEYPPAVGGGMAAVGLIMALICLPICLSAKKTQQKYALALTEYDRQLAEIRDIIKSCKDQLVTIEESFKLDRVEQKLAPYMQGHICVFVGWSSYLGSHFHLHPDQRPDYTHWVESNMVSVDGSEPVQTGRPFTAFPVDPGVHSIKIEGKNGSIDDEEEIQTDGRTVFLYIHYHDWEVVNFSQTTVHSKLYVLTGEDLEAFLKETHQWDDIENILKKM